MCLLARGCAFRPAMIATWDSMQIKYWLCDEDTWCDTGFHSSNHTDISVSLENPSSDNKLVRPALRETHKKEHH